MNGTIGPIIGLVGAGVLVGAAGLVFFWARRGAQIKGTHRVPIPWPGGGAVVGTPTLLTAGLCLALGAYHAASFSLAAMGRDVLPTPLRPGLWWVLPLGTAVAVGLSVWTDRLEERIEQRDEP